MQIIQSPLGNNIHPLGIISSLSNPERMLLKKSSHSLHSQSNFISTIQTKPPLVTASKFFLSRQYEPSIQPLIGWDSWDAEDMNREFPLVDFDYSDSITPLENSTTNSNNQQKDSISEIPSTRVKNTNDDTSPELNIENKAKSQSKRARKSQKPPEKKPKSKSINKKAITSSAAKNIEQLVGENNVNSNEDKTLRLNESLSIEGNFETPILQLNIGSGNITNTNNDDSTTTVINSPVFEDTSTLFGDIFTNDLHSNSVALSTLPSVELSPTETNLPFQEKIELDNNTSELVEGSSIEFPLNNIEKIFTPYNTFTDNKQTIIPEASDSVNIAHTPISPTPPQQDIEADKVTFIIENQSSATQTNLIQSKELSPTLISPLQEKELTNINSNSQVNTVIEPDLLLEKTTSNFVPDNPIIDNSLTLSAALLSPDIGNESSLLYPLANDDNALEKHIASPNSEPSVAKKPIIIQQEIDSDFSQHIENRTPNLTLQPTSLQEDEENLKPLSLHEKGFPDIGESQKINSSVTSEFADSAPVELTTTSTYIEDTSSLFSNSDNNEELVTSESHSAMALNVSANVTSLQRDSNFENTSSELTESQPILTASEIIEPSVVSAISPEIVETPTITTTSPEIVEPSVVRTISPEIVETPTITTTSPEIVEETNIVRKIIDNQQAIELENLEISTFVDTWDNPEIVENPTFEQDEVSTAPKIEQNAIAEKPAPKGYATGGHVTDSHVENRHQIAPSDTVPAMLSPGEFVINTKDAQKNLPLLHHINTGGTPHDIILPSLQTPNLTEPEAPTSPETPTKVDSFPDASLQLKSTETNSPQISNSLIPSSLGLNISQKKLSILNSPQLNSLKNETINVAEASPEYSSPPLIFRKANSTTNTSSQWSNTPSQWSNVEDLLNGNNDEFSSFNLNAGESNSQNYEFSQVSESPQVFAKQLPSARDFANGKDVNLPDISREIQPVTETIDNTSLSSTETKKDNTGDLEALAREIYNRLRQRIEIERERHGGYSGRLPW